MPFSTEEEALIASLRGIPKKIPPATHDALGRRFNPRGRRSLKNQAKNGSSTLSVGSVIEKIVERYQLQKPRLEALLMQNWRSIVGDENAHYCLPKKIEGDRKLIVAVSHSVIRSELLFQRRNILKRLNQFAGLEAIKEIIFVLT